jgi:hypothetical protein
MLSASYKMNDFNDITGLDVRVRIPGPVDDLMILFDDDDLFIDVQLLNQVV